MATLSEEVKPVASVNYEFENRQNSKYNRTFSDAHPINIPMYGTQTKTVSTKSHLKNYQCQFRR